MEVREFKKCTLESVVEVTALYSAFFQTMKPGEGSPGERHDLWEIVLVLDGELSAATDHEVLTLQKYQMIVHPPLEFHRHFNASDRETTFAIMAFDGTTMPSIRDFVFVLSREACNDYAEIISLIRETFEVKGCAVIAPKDTSGFSGQMVKLKTEQFLLMAFTGRLLPRDNQSEDYTRILTFLEENTHRNLTLDMIAKALNLSVSSLKRIFSSYTGVGVIHHFNRLRIQKAIRLLEAGESVQHVSEKLGFSSQSAFCTCFKTLQGYPPSKHKV